MTLQDHAAGGFRPTFADGSPDFTHPSKPGYRFADIDDQSRQKADAEYEARRVIANLN
jgi:hypothetical protein